MRIAFLVFNVDGMGGTARSVITQANALVEGLGEHEVEIISLTRTDSAPHHDLADGVSVRYLVDVADPDAPPATEPPGLVPPEAAARMVGEQSRYIPRRWDRQFNRLLDAGLEHALPEVGADVLVTTTPELLAVAAQLLPRGVALVHQEHRSTPARLADLPALLEFAPRADLLVTLTPYDAEWLAAQLGERTPELATMPNPLPREFAPRSRLDRPLIVSAGRLAQEKRFHQLVHAFGRVADRLPEWRLRIYGTGPKRGQLLALGRQYGLYDRLELPGAVASMAPEFAKASICAMSSRTEGFPLVAQEAMAAGVPVVTFDVPSGPREIVEHEVNGLLVDAGSRTGLAEALLRLATDEPLRQRLGASALASAAQYDPDRLAERWVGLFERAVALHRDRAVRPAAPTPPDPDLAPPGGEGAGLTPLEARAAALRLLTETTRAACGEGWFVIPPHLDEPPVLVVRGDRRRDLLTALAAADTPAFLSLREPEHEDWPARRGPVPEMAAALQRGMLPRFAVEPWPRVGDGVSVLASGATVEVQFWQRATDGRWVAPTRNRYCRFVTEGLQTVEAEVDGVPVRTLPEMTMPVVDECRFPIDVVYTWVDGADPEWNARREERLAQLTGTPLRRESSGRARFRSRDELRYSMRSLHLFAPWVRTIHLVTAGQVPDWLDTGDPRVRVVDHREIFPADALPTFNSHAIETRLHHVPGLAEHFVYVNDDVLLARPVRPERFFTPGGAFTAFLAEHPVGLERQQDRPYLAAAANNRRLLAERFGVFSTHTMAHTPHPHRRSVLAEIEAALPDEVAATTRSPFRSDQDVSLLSSLAQHWGLLSGSAVPVQGDVAYVDLGNAELARTLSSLAERERDFVCIADPHEFALLTDRVDAMLSEFLETSYPVRAPWELPDA